jgi:WD40 repeat protein
LLTGTNGRGAIMVRTTLKGSALVVALYALAAGASWVASDALPAKPLPDKQTRLDFYGDPLPPGALARLGTVRLRHKSAHVVFAADGKSLISVGVDRQVRFWDVTTGKQVRCTPLRRLKGTTASFQDATLAPGGKVVAAREGELVVLYDTATGKELRRLHAGPADYRRVSFAPDAKTLAVITRHDAKDTVRLWEVGTGKVYSVLGSKHNIWGLVFSPDGKLLTSSDGNKAIHVWDTRTGAELRSVRSQGWHLAMAPDGKTLAATDGETVTLRDTGALLERGVFKPSGLGGISRLAYSPDGKWLAIKGQNGIALWDVAARKELRRLPDDNDFGLAFAPNGKTLATWGEARIRLWNVATGMQIPRRSGHDFGVVSVAVSPDGKLIASASLRDRAMRLWDAATGKHLRRLDGPDRFVTSCGFSSDGKLALAAGCDGTFQLWETATGKERRRFAFEGLTGIFGGSCYEEAVRLSPDGKRVAAISLDIDGPARRQMHVWDASTGKLIARRSLHVDFHSRATPNGGSTSFFDFHCRFTPDGKNITVRTDKGLVVEETAAGREIVTIPGGLGRPLAFSPDGKLVAATILKPRRDPFDGYQQEGVCLAEVATGKEVLRIETGKVRHLALSPDGRVLATVDVQALRLWDVVTGKPLWRRQWSQGLKHRPDSVPVWSLTFMPGGRAIVTGMEDGTVLVWDLEASTWPATGIAKVLALSDLDALWRDLAGDDVRKAHRAVYTLAAAPARAIPFLRDHVRPEAEADPERVNRLIAQLDSNGFAVRKAATKELAILGEKVEPALRRLLAGKPSLEVRQRMEALLAARSALPSGGALRSLRAIRTLEEIGTPEARQVLRQLGAGNPAARATREANEALERKP